MMNEIADNGTVFGYLLSMPWVFGLMSMVVVAYIGKNRNESKARRIGYELEVIKNFRHNTGVHNESLAHWLYKVGKVPTVSEGYNHQTRQHTKIVSDGSLSSGGCEIVSPPLEEGDRRNWLSKVTSAIAGLVTIDRTCGIHVHVDMSQEVTERSATEVYRLAMKH